MKKVSLLAILFAATATTGALAQGGVPSECPRAFKGFWLGGQIGYVTGQDKFKAGALDGADDEEGSRRDLGFRGVDGGLGVGYDHRFGSWLVGIGFDATWSNAKGKIRHFSRDDDESEGLAHSLKLENSLQLYGKAGYVICEKVLPFIALGWDNSAYKAKTVFFETGDDDVTAHKKKRINSFMWRAGVDFLMTKHVIMGIQYTGTAGGKIKRTFTNDDDVVVGHNDKPQNNKFSLTVRVIY